MTNPPQNSDDLEDVIDLITEEATNFADKAPVTTFNTDKVRQALSSLIQWKQAEAYSKGHRDAELNKKGKKCLR